MVNYYYQAGSQCNVKSIIKGLFTGYGKVPEYECSMRCPGNSDQICGNHWRNSLYDLGSSSTDTGEPGSADTDGNLGKNLRGAWAKIWKMWE